MLLALGEWPQLSDVSSKAVSGTHIFMAVIHWKYLNVPIGTNYDCDHKYLSTISTFTSVEKELGNRSWVPEWIGKRCALPAVCEWEKQLHKFTNSLPVDGLKVRLQIAQDSGSPHSILCLLRQVFRNRKSENASLCFIFMCIFACPQTDLSSVRSSQPFAV